MINSKIGGFYAFDNFAAMSARRSDLL